MSMHDSVTAEPLRAARARALSRADPRSATAELPIACRSDRWRLALRAGGLCVLEQMIADEDRRVRAQRDRNGIARPRVDLDALTSRAQRERRVVGATAQVRHHD